MGGTLTRRQYVEVGEPDSDNPHSHGRSRWSVGCDSRHDPCETCEAAKDHGGGPPHDASPDCKSGGHKHCTCDVCF
jgi:hypothetical protein